jgi:hypothetical protein
MIAKVIDKLNVLITKIQDRINPVFTKLESLGNLHIGDGFATIDGVEVDATAIGISDAIAFIGIPPAGGFDWTQPFDEQDAIGLFVDDLNMALGMFKPRARPVPELHRVEADRGQRRIRRRRRRHLRAHAGRHHGRAEPRRPRS